MLLWCYRGLVLVDIQLKGVERQDRLNKERWRGLTKWYRVCLRKYRGRRKREKLSELDWRDRSLEKGSKREEGIRGENDGFQVEHFTRVDQRLLGNPSTLHTSSRLYESLQRIRQIHVDPPLFRQTRKRLEISTLFGSFTNPICTLEF